MDTKRNTYSAVIEALPIASKSILNAAELPEVLQQEAEGVYIRRTLEEVSSAINTLTALRRKLVDEALRSRSVTHREIQRATGIGLTTLQRYRAVVDQPTTKP